MRIDTLTEKNLINHPIFEISLISIIISNFYGTNNFFFYLTISDYIKRYISVDIRVWVETLFLRIQVKKKKHKSKNATCEKKTSQEKSYGKIGHRKKKSHGKNQNKSGQIPGGHNSSVENHSLLF